MFSAGYIRPAGEGPARLPNLPEAADLGADPERTPVLDQYIAPQDVFFRSSGAGGAGSGGDVAAPAARQPSTANQAITSIIADTDYCAAETPCGGVRSSIEFLWDYPTPDSGYNAYYVNQIIAKIEDSSISYDDRANIMKFLGQIRGYDRGKAADDQLVPPHVEAAISVIFELVRRSEAPDVFRAGFVGAISSNEVGRDILGKYLLTYAKHKETPKNPIVADRSFPNLYDFAVGLFRTEYGFEKKGPCQHSVGQIKAWISKYAKEIKIDAIAGMFRSGLSMAALMSLDRATNTKGRVDAVVAHLKKIFEQNREDPDALGWVMAALAKAHGQDQQTEPKKQAVLALFESLLASEKPELFAAGLNGAILLEHRSGEMLEKFIKKYEEHVLKGHEIAQSGRVRRTFAEAAAWFAEEYPTQARLAINALATAWARYDSTDPGHFCFCWKALARLNPKTNCAETPLERETDGTLPTAPLTPITTFGDAVLVGLRTAYNSLSAEQKSQAASVAASEIGSIADGKKIAPYHQALLDHIIQSGPEGRQGLVEGVAKLQGIKVNQRRAAAGILLDLANYDDVRAKAIEVLKSQKLIFFNNLFDDEDEVLCAKAHAFYRDQQPIGGSESKSPLEVFGIPYIREIEGYLKSHTGKKDDIIATLRILKEEKRRREPLWSFTPRVGIGFISNAGDGEPFAAMLPEAGVAVGRMSSEYQGGGRLGAEAFFVGMDTKEQTSWRVGAGFVFSQALGRHFDAGLKQSLSYLHLSGEDYGDPSYVPVEITGSAPTRDTYLIRQAEGPSRRRLQAGVYEAEIFLGFRPWGETFELAVSVGGMALLGVISDDKCQFAVKPAVLRSGQAAASSFESRCRDRKETFGIGGGASLSAGWRW